MTRIISALAVLLLLMTPAVGQDFQKGYTAYQRDDYATALKEFWPLAERGNADAQYYLGGMFLLAKGVPRDFVEAEKWLRSAAENGNDEAKGLLGGMYALGRGVPKDYVQAYMWFSLASTQKVTGSVVVKRTLTERMNPEQIAEAEQMAREWLEKHQT